jgi:hypothetical protein
MANPNRGTRLPPSLILLVAAGLFGACGSFTGPVAPSEPGSPAGPVSGQRRVTERFGQFVTWSPDGRFILVSPGGCIARPDGSGATTLPASDEGGGLDFAEWLR